MKDNSRKVGAVMEYVVGIVLAAVALLLIPQPFGLILVLGVLIGAVMRMSDRVARHAPNEPDVPASARDQVRAQMARYEQDWRERQANEER